MDPKRYLGKAKRFVRAHRRQPDWVYPFVEWAHGRTEELDFGGANVPPRVTNLLERPTEPPAPGVEA